MESLSSLPIQYSTGSRADISQGGEKCSGTIEEAQAQHTESRTSFQARLTESIIDVYERSQENVVVPDERTGIDRRRSATRRRSFQESAPLQTDKIVTDVDPYLTDKKIIQNHRKTEKNPLTVFSSSPEVGRFINTWA